MDTNRLISSLCYFSIFFAGFIFPIAVYFIVDHHEVKEHAKKSFLSHLIPLVSIPIFFLLFLFPNGEGQFFFVIIMFIVFGLINLAVIIWNVVKGIQVLRD